MRSMGIKKYLILFVCSIGFWASAQEAQLIKGVVLNDANDQPMENVNIVNLNRVTGTSSNAKGEFAIEAAVNDTLFFSRLAFETIQVRVTEDWTKYGDVKIKMTEVGIALEEVVIQPMKLTGYLEIDAKNIPIYENYRYSISGLRSGYEGGETKTNGVSKVLGAIFNPADMLHHIFGNKPRQMRKLKQMREDDEIRNLLQQKYDRETLVALLQIDKVNIEEILSRCNYSKDFIKNANDLQILDAISGCYEEYKVLNRE